MTVVVAEFWVNGSSIPLVDFDVGDSWAGLLPISNATDETRQVWVFQFDPAIIIGLALTAAALNAVVLLVLPSRS